MTGHVRSDKTRNFLLRLLGATSNQAPKLIVIEDAHWFDTASWALALAVAQRIRPILLVITALMLRLTAWRAGKAAVGFHVDGFWTALVGALIITLVTGFIDFVVDDED